VHTVVHASTSAGHVAVTAQAALTTTFTAAAVISLMTRIIHPATDNRRRADITLRATEGLQRSAASAAATIQPGAE
jgi:hypothetical protein